MTERALSLIEVERRGRVAVIWMTDSARRNALSVKLVTELLGALASSSADGADAVVIASREKAFCAGADIRDMLDSGWLEARSGAAGLTPPDLFEAIETDRRPILAAVDGATFGGGVELCLACDLVIATPTSTFMLPELGLGVLPNTALARLPYLVGARAAARLIMTRQRIDAAEAFRLGLITELVTDLSAVDRAVATANDIIDKVPPTAFAAAKRSLRRGPDWATIRSILGDMDSEEWREGTTAFVEKRPPDYARFWNGSNDDR
ncbi:enoyl-CoA hydratase/isomerase family protein [Sphingomonas sp. RT2P30]|uniref:enoyl-CoA hydratase/isomerase family protein n=1 Tax=Parasphingomonas halimpatiens TaxID=3096162 RepID=UPI002FCC7713